MSGRRALCGWNPGGRRLRRRDPSEDSPDGLVLGLDWDEEAIERVRERFPHDPRLFLRRASFSDLHAILEEMQWEPVDGIVVDLGVSTFQLADPRRGFSFLQEGPLDMRMTLDFPVLRPIWSMPFRKTICQT